MEWNKRDLKVQAINNAVAIHSSAIISASNTTQKPSDVLETAKSIYEWLKK